jgi:hypothetical protein
MCNVLDISIKYISVNRERGGTNSQSQFDVLDTRFFCRDSAIQGKG